MEKWREDYNRYMNKCSPQAESLDDPSIIHHCPSCSNYLWADKNHKSYRHCIHCGKNLKGVTLPYELI